MKAGLAFVSLAILLFAIAGANQALDRCSLLPIDHFFLFSKRVITPAGIISASVEIDNGKVVSILERQEAPSKEINGVPVMDYGNAVVMPGLIDAHVHLNEPGREEWEGFVTGTMAAAAGGVTSLVDMPLNSFPTTTSSELLKLKLASAAEKLMVDVGFWGGLVPENAANLTILDELLDTGALGLKSFMCPSGINDFPMTTGQHIQVFFQEAALPVLAKYGRPLLVHAEKEQPGVKSSQVDKDPRLYSTHLESRPNSEQEAIRELLDVAKDTAPGGKAEGARVHIVHLSDADESIQMIKKAKAQGLNVSVETCTHYLAFSSDNIGDGDTRYKCAPPIRSELNRKKLWSAVNDDFFDLLSSDHSPSPSDMKLPEEGDFMRAWGGISSLQFVLPATWTAGIPHGLTLEKLSNLWSRGPAKLANIYSSKGSLEPGKDADIVVWDPESSFVIDENYTIFHKHKLTPYAGQTLYGRVIATIVRGQHVYQEGHHATQPCGKVLLAKSTS
ncbi:hypothetical protein SELMODRAFT_442187 [Selaginella moellendorffii]|uniref:allantoinase n=1 Tax=Selaginella moellendorffii TaxID=88036 RepID=D8RRF9_SELML|nr:hypothetical protein SELMODRAFT_442187 [Selaginella moellendorffii]